MKKQSLSDFAPPLAQTRTNSSPESQNPVPCFAGGANPRPPFFSKLKLWLLAFLTALLAGLPGAAAQITGQRMDLHQLTGAEQQALANLIHAWLDANPGVVDDHANPDCFNEIHTTRNFMPWHRTHLRMLENYIAEQTGNPAYRLPKWDPGVTPPSGDKIPSFFKIRASTDMDAVPAINVNPVPTTEMTDFLDDLALPCGVSSDAGAFSNALEGYHNQGHGSVGGFFTNNAAPDCLIFWPWHAWVDDLWYVWERDCGYNGAEAYYMPDVVGATETVISGPDVHWSGERFIKGIVRITNGAALEIDPGAIIHFRESQYNAFPTRIVVEPGGKLVVNSNARLTGIDEFGNGGDGMTGSKYYTGWDGIIVQGNPASEDEGDQGRVDLQTNCRIEHMVNGIRSENGGIIAAETVNFYNNRRDVEIRSYAFDHASYFTGCNFVNDLPLRDAEWQASGSACNETEHHLGHAEQSHSSEAHILLRGVKGVIFQNCTINNTFQDPHGNYVSLGIEGRDAQFTVEQCTISNQVIGISATNKVPGPGKNLTLRGSNFDNNFEGVRLWGVDNSVIEATNVFIVPDEIPTGVTPPDMLSNIGAPFGVYSLGSSGLTVADNQFSTVGAAVSEKNYGVILDYTSSSFAASTEKRNTFTGIGIASQTQGINANLQIRCNNYNDFRYGIAVTSGTLMDQGECIFNDETAPANNTWDNPGCVGDESQIYKDASATSFDYRAHTNQLPTCYSSGVTPVDCQTSSTSLSCINGEPPPCEGCELQRIADLEADKNVLPSGDERRQFITHEQQSIYQQGVNERMENEGVDDAIEFTEDVEAITALWPGNKAALLLLKSEQEDAIASGTVAAIAAVAATDPNKKWLELRYDLLTSGRTYSQITATEKAMVEAEAEQQTKSGAHAKAILEDVYGVQIQPYIELIGGERSSKPVAVTTTTSNWSIAPNPAQHNVVVLFTAPETAHQSSLEITDVNGRTLRQFDLSHHFGDSQQAIPVDGFSPGIYLVRLSLNGIVVGVEKMAVIR